MTNAELVERISRDTALSKAVAGRVLDTTIELVKKALKKGERVTLVGFGTFSVSKRKARTDKYPSTGTTLKLPVHKAPKFTAGQGLKDAVR